MKNRVFYHENPTPKDKLCIFDRFWLDFHDKNPYFSRFFQFFTPKNHLIFTLFLNIFKNEEVRKFFEDVITFDWVDRFGLNFRHERIIV